MKNRGQSMIDLIVIIFISIIIAGLIVVAISFVVPPEPSLHNSEWQCIPDKWEETDDWELSSCRLIDRTSPTSSFNVKCEHKKVCTQEYLVRDVK